MKIHLTNRLLILFFFFVRLSVCVAQEESAQDWLNKGLGLLYSNPKQAIHYAEKALMACPDKPNVLRVRALLLQARAETLLGDFDSCIAVLYDALDACPSNEQVLLGALYTQMAGTYSSLLDYTKAFELNEKAVHSFQTVGDSLGLANCYNTRGLIHCNLNELKEADRYFQKALAINRKFKNIKSVAANLNNMCLYAGNLQEKLGYINEAIVINRNLQSTWSLGENYNNMGKQYYYAGQYKFALDALHKAKEVAEQVGAKELICDNYEYLSWVYFALHDYKNAYECQGKLLALSKDLQSTSKLRSVEQKISQKRYQSQQVENQFREQAYEIQLLQRTLLSISAVLVIFVLLVLFTTMWYKRKKKMQLMESNYKLEQSERVIAELKVQQQEIALQTVTEERDTNRQELTTVALFLRSRNELLERIRNMIREGYRMEASLLVPHLKKISTFIGQCQNGDKSNSALLATTEEKNAQFLAALAQMHPNLTSGERYLATLLRVNLSTKEIALLTGTQPKTINMNRYRLRKSLDLPSETDLIQYLQNIH